MSSKILVAYSTRYGSTEEVAQAVAAAMRETGLEVDLQLLKKVKSLDAYRAVVIGAPLFMFQWHNDAKGFLSRHREALMQRPVAVFALGPVHDPHDDQEWQSSHDQLNKELANFPWFKPVALEMFGGKYDPSKLRFPIKQLAGDAPPTDIRDWDAIRAWASGLKSILSA